MARHGRSSGRARTGEGEPRKPGQREQAGQAGPSGEAGHAGQSGQSGRAGQAGHGDAETARNTAHGTGWSSVALGGGLLAVAVVVAAMNLRPSVTSVGAVLDDVQRSLGASGTWAGAVTTMPGLCFSVAGFGAPWLARRIGLGNAVAAALAVLAVGLVTRVLNGPFVVLAGTLVASAGIALANVLIPVVVKTSFAARIGVMTGVYTAALQLGGALGSSLTPPLTQGLGGWRGGLGGWAVLAALALALWLAAWRPARTGAGEPFGGGGAASATSATKAATAGPDGGGRRSLLGNRLAWIVTGFFGCQACFAYIMMGWMPQVLIDAGVDRTTAGLLLGLVSLLGLPVSLFVPPLVTARGGLHWWTLALGVFGIGGVTGLLAAPSAAPLLWSVLIGLGMAVFSLAIAAIALRARTGDDTATLSGMAQGFGYLLGALGPFLFGLLHDLTGAWTASLAMVLVVLTGQLTFGWFAGKGRSV